MCESSAGKGFYHAMIAGVYLFLLISKAVVATAQSLPGTDLLTSEGNFADKNTSQIIDFLEKKISESEQHRAKYWNRQFADRKTYEQSVEKNRDRFRHIIGARDKRQSFDEPELAGTLDVPSMIAETKTHKVYTVRWPVFELLNGEGLLVKPKNGKATATVILIPPPGVTPEQTFGSFMAGTGAPGKIVKPDSESVNDYYACRIKKPERTEIHRFDGRHKINGEKTYPFLDKWLKNF